MKPIVEGTAVAKKFCRDYKRSIRYAFRDIFRLASFRDIGTDVRPGEFWALKDVSFSIQPGESLGIVGANGCGKTTLLRMVSGFLRPDCGNIKVRGRVSPIFARGAGFDPVLSGYENIQLCLSMLGLNKKQIKNKIDSVVAFSELSDESLRSPIKTYSSGMNARLGFSCIVNSDPSLLVIDEALAVGDMQFRLKCYQKLAELKKQGTSFFLVSHSPNAIIQACDRAIYLQKGQLKFDGDVRQALNLYDKDEQERVSLKASIPSSAESACISFMEGLEIVEVSSSEMHKEIFLGMTGEKLALQVDVNSHENLPDIYFHLVIRSEREPLQNFVHLSRKVGAVAKGKQKINIELSSLSLRPGNYQLKLFFSLEDQLRVLSVAENIIMEVRADGYFRGSHFQSMDITTSGLH